MNIDADALHRTAKLELDEGHAATIEEAMDIAASYVLQIDVGADIADSPTRQAMLLTAVNTGARAFLGGVHVRTSTNPRLASRWANGQDMIEAIRTYGGTPTERLSRKHPTLTIGNVTGTTGAPVLHLTWNGWAAAAVREPTNRLAETHDFPLAGAAAAALGVSELFQYARGSTRTGWRDVGLSLWQPGGEWQQPEAAGPTCPYLPKRLLIAGLGHLGQATCWVLGLLPYKDASEVEFTLQDFDRVVEANQSTGLLTTRADLNQRKTRIVAAKLEQIGFTTTIIERRVDANTQRTQDEPRWALAGFDQLEPRRHLANAGFDKIVDVGLGAGAHDYLDILINIFPSAVTPEETWPSSPPAPKPHDLPVAYENAIRKAMQHGATEGEARCGAVQLAGRSVAASFVGVAAATLVVAETLRELLGGKAEGVPSNQTLSLSLAHPNRAIAVPNCGDTSANNPGFVTAHP